MGVSPHNRYVELSQETIDGIPAKSLAQTLEFQLLIAVISVLFGDPKGSISKIVTKLYYGDKRDGTAVLYNHFVPPLLSKLDSLEGYIQVFLWSGED